ncbi:hypothetical protein BDN67DRAFT_965328, partial [Paxillus ammoniavirescens]
RVMEFGSAAAGGALGEEQETHKEPFLLVFQQSSHLHQPSNPFILALLAIVSTATATDSDCHTVCCTQSNLAPSGWQGTGCTAVEPDGACAYTKFCCYTIQGDAAAVCTSPQQS